MLLFYLQYMYPWDFACTCSIKVASWQINDIKKNLKVFNSAIWNVDKDRTWPLESICTRIQCIFNTDVWEWSIQKQPEVIYHSTSVVNMWPNLICSKWQHCGLAASWWVITFWWYCKAIIPTKPHCHTFVSYMHMYDSKAWVNCHTFVSYMYLYDSKAWVDCHTFVSYMYCICMTVRLGWTVIHLWHTVQHCSETWMLMWTYFDLIFHVRELAWIKNNFHGKCVGV